MFASETCGVSQMLSSYAIRRHMHIILNFAPTYRFEVNTFSYVLIVCTCIIITLKQFVAKMF